MRVSPTVIRNFSAVAALAAQPQSATRTIHGAKTTAATTMTPVAARRTINTAVTSSQASLRDLFRR